MTITINERLDIPLSELRFTFSRASGPGGQHVNTADTKVTLIFDVEGSPSLTETMRKRIQQKLANRIGADGTLKLSCDSERSRNRNRDIVIRRFAEMLRRALIKPKRRRPTRPTKNSIKRRLTAKKQRGNTKKARKKPGLDE